MLHYVDQGCVCKPTEGVAIRKCDQLRRLAGVCEVTVEDKTLDTCAACCVTDPLTGCVNGLTGKSATTMFYKTLVRRFPFCTALCQTFDLHSVLSNVCQRCSVFCLYKWNVITQI